MHLIAPTAAFELECACSSAFPQRKGKSFTILCVYLSVLCVGPFRDFPELTVYHARPGTNENTFANLGMDD